MEEKLYDAWSKRDANFETHYEKTLFRTLAEYGGGSSESVENKGKVYGAGYELYIVAFFIGLYADKKIKVASPYKKFGQPIQYWGNVGQKKLRKDYSKLKDYIFAALIDRTEVDWLKLERDEIQVAEVVKMLCTTMDEYANYGLEYMQDKMKEESGVFFKHTGFLDVFLNFMHKP